MTSTVEIKTAKAERLMKALCNHFARKTQASYENNQGHIQFQFGNCELESTISALIIRVESSDLENLSRTQRVVAEHLIRFAPEESLQFSWNDAS